MKTVLLTGASSAAGARILEVLAARPDVTRVYLLGGGDAARAPAEAAAKEVLPLPGDVKLPRLGLDGKGFEQAIAADTIIHCAERTELDQDLPRAREWNVQPVRSLIELLQEARGARLVHLSTTWVAGTKRGLFTEFDLDCRQGFYNAYEQSKHEAECLLRDSAVSGRVTIVRRSLALGAPGRPGSILQPLRGRRLLVSGDSRIRVDVIPLEYLAQGTVALADHPAAAGRTCHLVAGWEKSWTLRALLELVKARCGAGGLGFLPPVLSSLARAMGPLSFGRVAVLPGRRRGLRPYLHQRCVFDEFMARSLLEPLGIACPPPDEFMARVLDATLAPPGGAGAPAAMSEAA